MTDEPDSLDAFRQVYPDPHPVEFLFGQAVSPGGERFLVVTLFHMAGETTVFFATEPGEGVPSAARSFLMAGLDAVDAITATPQGLHLPKDSQVD